MIRTFETIAHLAARNRVTLLAPLRYSEEEEHVVALNRLCENVITTTLSDDIQPVLRRLTAGLLRWRPLIQSMHYDPSLAREIRRVTSRQTYEIIHVEFSFMAPYLQYVSPLSRAKKVLSMHNVESLRFARELRFARGFRRIALLTDRVLFSSWEQHSLKLFDGVLTVSPSELAWVRRQAPTIKAALVPNGVDTEFFSLGFGASVTPSLVFTALMNYPPNIDAAGWFCNEILPIVRAKHAEVCFKIVGDKPDRAVLALAQRKGVQVTGRVPDVRPYLAESLAVVVPIRSGGGTRLKILEAMAMGRPVVSTRQGAEGLEITDGVNILLADTPEEFARCIFALIANPQLGKQLGNAARHLAVSKYAWRTCLSGLENLYHDLLGDSPEPHQEVRERDYCSQYH